MPRHNPKSTAANPDFEDIAAAMLWIEQELDARMRYITLCRITGNKEEYLDTTLQLYRIYNGKAWVMAERKFSWKKGMGRSYPSMLIIEVHKSLHDWGNRAFAPPS